MTESVEAYQDQHDPCWLETQDGTVSLNGKLSNVTQYQDEDGYRWVRTPYGTAPVIDKHGRHAKGIAGGRGPKSSVSDPDGERYLTSRQLAELLHLSIRTIERWRCSGAGPPVVAVGRRCLYRESDVTRWIEERIFGSTSERDTAGRDAA